jgi:hypothetical protein
MYILKPLLTQNIATRHSVMVAFLTPQKFARPPHWYYWRCNRQFCMNTTGATDGEHTFLYWVLHERKGMHKHLHSECRTYPQRIDRAAFPPAAAPPCAPWSVLTSAQEVDGTSWLPAAVPCTPHSREPALLNPRSSLGSRGPSAEGGRVALAA